VLHVDSFLGGVELVGRNRHACCCPRPAPSSLSGLQHALPAQHDYRHQQAALRCMDRRVRLRESYLRLLWA